VNGIYLAKLQESVIQDLDKGPVHNREIAPREWLSSIEGIKRGWRSRVALAGSFETGCVWVCLRQKARRIGEIGVSNKSEARLFANAVAGSYELSGFHFRLDASLDMIPSRENVA
jgi:hypothetical protein